MSNIFLSANDTFTQPSTNTNDTISGRAGGSETVILQGNPSGTILDGNIETVEVAGSAANTTLQVNAITGRLELVSSGVVYASFSGGLNQAVDLQFTDGNVTLTQTGASSFTITTPTNTANSATVSATTPQAGSAVQLGTSISAAGAPVPPSTFPTFSISAGAATVDEGSIVTFSLSTTNVAAGTSVPYIISGVSTADIVGALTGTAIVGATGAANISVQVAADQLTEGAETLTLSVNNGSASASTIIQDTSVAPASNSYISGQGGNGVTSNYNIELIFQGAFTTDQRSAFEKAADYISALITGDVPDTGGVDDIRITTVIEPGDGLGGTLASAGPTALRPGSLLPFEGNMTFDTADANQELAAGTFVDTVAHEMLHALGFGTIWEAADLGLLSETSGLRFTGPNAIAAYNAIFTTIAAGDANSTTGVPVETDGGAGTARGHWDEAIFTNEILTGFDDPVDIMSGMTVAALEDMGYDTIFDVGVPAATMPQLSDFMFA